jgi:hypothetical protein
MAAVERADAAIEHARATLARAILTANVQNDPLRPALEAQLAGVEAQAELVGALSDIASRAAQPVSDQQLREFTHGAVRLMETLLLHRMVQVNRALVLGAMAAAIVCLCIGYGAGWLTWGGAPQLTCSDQQGGRYCGVWIVPPRATR